MTSAGDPSAEGNTLCRRCSELKSVQDFGRNRSRPDGLAEYCRGCYSQISKASYRRRRAAVGQSVREVRSPPPGMAWCPDCADFKTVEEFPRNRATASGLAAYCKVHQNLRTRESRLRVHGDTRTYHLRHRYGVTAAEVDEMRQLQDDRCAICTRELGERPHVDHNPATGAVRGLLCFTCNVGLGNFSDDVERLRRAIAYLGQHPGVEVSFELSPRPWHLAAAV